MNKLKNKKNIISFEEIQKEFPGKKIIEKVSFGIHENEKIGLIGVNGCGKSTFLKILTGEEYLDSGKITFRSKIKVSYLPQIPKLNMNFSIFEQIYHSDNEKFALLRQYHKISRDFANNNNPALYQKQQDIIQQIDRREAWEIEIKAKSYLSKLGFNSFEKKIDNLSGGQKRRIDLARVLMEESDVLVLDEPTNHLDMDTIEWMQDFLKNYPGVVIFVTHDRYFLDDVSSRIMEIENAKIRFYDGNYSEYIKQKEMQGIDLQRKETRRKAQLQKELKRLKRGAKARTSKPKNHVDRVKELIDKSYLSESKELNISFQTHRLGKTILEAKSVSKKYDKKLFENFTHIFQKKERIGIIGKNGSGKTTLLKLLTNEIKPDKGKIKVGVNTKFAYFKQNIQDFDDNMTVFEYIAQFAEKIRTKDGTLHSAAEMLEKFLFDPKMQRSKLSTLSGGEKKRLYLLRSLMFGSNFLILDEPTNDLDIKTLEILEDYLDSFNGCLLVVSHDRYFLDRVIDYLFILENNKINKFSGNYSDYLLVKRFREAEEKKYKKEKSKANKNISKSTKTKTKLSYHEKRELKKIEKQIETLENKKSELNSTIETKAASLSPMDFQDITNSIKEINTKLDELLLRWTELEEKKEKLAKQQSLFNP